jgi:N-acetylmuramoyl-L-alanine amidase
LDEVRGRWAIEDALILGHSDVAPRRKQDPGELFPWKRLAEAGHGLWAEPRAAPGPLLTPGETGLGVLALRGALQRLGYELAVDGAYDEDLATVVAAFQRHWRQDRCDGLADGETRARLTAILRLASS